MDNGHMANALPEELLDVKRFGPTSSPFARFERGFGSRTPREISAVGVYRACSGFGARYHEPKNC